MSGKKQIEEMPKITRIYEPIKITDEMRKIANEMQEAISTEYKKRVLADERELEAVLRENGWRKASEVAREVLALVWDAYQTTHYDAEFEERLDRIEEKYTEGE